MIRVKFQALPDCDDEKSLGYQGVASSYL